MDTWQWLTLIGFVIAAIGLVLQVYDKIPERYVKKLLYLILNKKFKIKISAIRKYPQFDWKINEVKKEIQSKLLEQEVGIDNQVYAKNYIQILIKDLQAPYLIKFEHDVDPYNPDERTTVSISLLGTIDFRYNDNLDNRKYLSDIEDFFKIIESVHKVHFTYENYNLVSIKPEYKGHQTSNKIVKKDNSTINIGESMLNIHSTSLTKLYDVFKKNASAI